jgi:hypothetical protein
MPSPSRFIPLLSVVVLAAACTASSSATRAPVAAEPAPPPAPDDPTTAPPRAQTDPPPPDPFISAPPSPPPEPAAPRVAARPIAPVPVGAYRVRVVDDGGRALPTYASAGRTYVMGTIGSRYSIAIQNPTPTRVEAVISVDGLDAMDGHPADYVHKRGYIIPAFGSTTVDGFRTSFDEVATFRFSSVADSYAGRLGDARDVGVIGVAFFPERPPPVVAQDLGATPSHHYPMPSAPAHARRRAAPSDIAPSPAGGGATATTTPRPPAPPSERPGLGTEFGEARESHIGTTSFERASQSAPAMIAMVRYNDRAGLTALGVISRPVYPSTDLELRETAQPFPALGFAQPPP